MLERLRTPSVIAKNLIETAKNPFGTLSDAVVIFRAQVAAIVRKVADVQLSLRYGVSQKEVITWMRSILFLPETERRAAMRELIGEGMNGEFETLYSLISKLSNVDVLGLAEKERGAQPLTQEDMLLPLQIDYELFTEFIAVAQSHLRFGEWMKFLDKKNKAVKDREKKDTMDDITLDGAALPEMFPKITEYEKKIEAYVNARGGRKGKSFKVMTDAFKAMAARIFGDDLEAYYGFGTTPTAKSLVLRFWEYYPDAELVASPYEYLPIWYLVDKAKRHMVDLPHGLEFSEEDLAQALLKKGQSIVETRSRAEKPPIVFLISSQLRVGGKLLDTRKIEKLVEAENEKLGYKQYHLWFDASQDSRTIKEGDIVLYSKRCGGTGAGMAVAKKATYPEDARDVQEAFRTRSGYPFCYIPRIVAALFVQEKKIGHRFKDLLHPNTQTLWYYSGKGTFLEQEIEKAKSRLEASGLKELFTMTAALPDTASGQWRIDAVVRLTPTEKGHELLDLHQLEKDLADLNVTVSNFNLEDCEGGENRPKFSQLMKEIDREPFDLYRFVEITEEFQKFYSQEIVAALLPVEDRENPDHVKSHFLRIVKRHNYFRIFVTAIARPDTLVDFVQRLEMAVKRQLKGR